MKKSIKFITAAVIMMLLIVSGCQPDNTTGGFSMYKPSKYEITADSDKPVKINITYLGRINQVGGYNETDPQSYTVETTTPWEYAMMTCKDFTYFLYVENIDTIEVTLTGKVVIDDVTVAEQSGEWIDMQFEY